MTATTIDFKALAAPFDKIHWRAQSVSNKNPDAPKAMALAYMDARDVMDRLDAVCGIAGWQDSYVETERGRVVCTLSLFIGGQWVSKSDGAGDTAVEGEKGGLSDAFKRAAVKWGIGRYLYAMKTPWAACELYNGKWSKWTPEGLAYLNKIHAAYVPEQPANDTGSAATTKRAEKWEGPYSGKSALHKGLVEIDRNIRGCGDLAELESYLATDEYQAFQTSCQRYSPHYLSGGDPAPPEFVGIFDLIKSMRAEYELRESEGDNDVRHVMEGRV